ncbi:MAG TPA: cyclic pyranopterin monophosphate synthase MoaC [Gemmatimonadaceae bacterium]|jgi:cyclic pyranopterin phosphate synthase|nr:cyclic pyranopterin monophosphate synthase MoaC [Gemmatimonadaceae bacterium]
MNELSHIDHTGQARMVDVTEKAITDRFARATGIIRMKPETLAAIQRNSLAKGDVISVARVAGVMAAKRTAELIPLCHPLPLTDVQVVVTPDETLPGLRVEAAVKTTGKTGVEMEAMTAVAVSLITVYDMAKAVDKEMQITDICLLEKSGGRSGHWQRR